MVATLKKKMNSTERDRLDASAKASEEVINAIALHLARVIFKRVLENEFLNTRNESNGQTLIEPNGKVLW